jgi:hypothetical protein
LQSAQKITIFEPIKPYNRLMQYNWQQPGWPHFPFDPLLHEAAGSLFIQKAAYAQGILDSTGYQVNLEG